MWSLLHSISLISLSLYGPFRPWGAGWGFLVGQQRRKNLSTPPSTHTHFAFEKWPLKISLMLAHVVVGMYNTGKVQRRGPWDAFTTVP